MNRHPELIVPAVLTALITAIACIGIIVLIVGVLRAVLA